MHRMEGYVGTELEGGELIGNLNPVENNLPFTAPVAESGNEHVRGKWRQLYLKYWRRKKIITILEKWEENDDGLHKAMDDVMKFQGEFMEFGDKSLFDQGLQAQLGNPDPCVFQAILSEHIGHKSGFLTSNYGIYTTPIVELSHLLGNSTRSDRVPHEFVEMQKNPLWPSELDLKISGLQFDELNEMKTWFQKYRNGIYPGDAGDVLIQIPVVVSREVPDNIARNTMGESKIMDQKQANQLVDKMNKKLNAFAEKQEIFKDGHGCVRGVGCFTPVGPSSNLKDLKLKVAVQFIAEEPGSTDGSKLEMQKNRTLKMQHLVGMLREELPDTTWQVGVEEPVRVEYLLDPPDNTGRFKQARMSMSIRELMEVREVKEAGLRFEEAMMQHLYTGPMYQLWNTMLRDRLSGKPEGASAGSTPGARQQGSDDFSTSMLTLVSAVKKSSLRTRLPKDRRVYRGLGGRLPRESWLSKDERGTCGGVERAFMSTTMSRDMALQYSGINNGRGVIFELEVGSVDCGAMLGGVSQYQKEQEMLFNPLCFLEVLGARVESLEWLGESREVVVFRLKVNCNLKAMSIEELEGERKKLLQSMTRNMIKEIDFEKNLLGINKAGRHGSDQCKAVSGRSSCMLKRLRELGEELEVEDQPDEWFNVHENFLSTLSKAVKAKDAIISVLLEEHVARSKRTSKGTWSDRKERCSTRASEYYNQALLVAAARGRSDLVSLLVRHGADVRYQDDDWSRKNALMLAFEVGAMQVVKTLLVPGHRNLVYRLYSIYFKSMVLFFGVCSYVSVCVISINDYVFLVILRETFNTQSAPTNTTNSQFLGPCNGTDFVSSAFVKEMGLSYVIFLTFGAFGGLFLFLLAIYVLVFRFPSNQIRQFIGGHYPNVNATCTEGMTALHYAACRGDAKSLIALSPIRESSNIMSFQRFTVFGDRLGILCAGRPIQDHQGKTALHYAAQKGSPELMEWFSQEWSWCAHAMLIKDKKGRIPLHYACMARSAAGPTQDKDPDCREARAVRMMLCQMRRFRCIFRALFYCWRIQDENGRTALHIACCEGRPAIVRMLLRCGVDTDVRDGSGLTPLECARAAGSLECVALLENRSRGRTDQSAPALPPVPDPTPPSRAVGDIVVAIS